MYFTIYLQIMCYTFQLVEVKIGQKLLKKTEEKKFLLITIFV